MSTIRMTRRETDEIPLETIQRVMKLGDRQAEIKREMKVAIQNNDRNLVWELAEALCRVEDRIYEEAKL